MEADVSFPGWGGWSTPPPSTAIHPSMKFVALRLAKWWRSSHVRTTPLGALFCYSKS